MVKMLGFIESRRIDDDHIKLLKKFVVIDSRGVRWTARKNLISDGATLKIFKNVPGIGHPLDGDYLEASVIHDQYCKTKSRSQKDTHRIFRELLEADGVPKIKAWAMWAAVRIYNRVKNKQWK
jgi:hypothetical protein